MTGNNAKNKQMAPANEDNSSPAGEDSIPPIRIHETPNYITAIIGGKPEDEKEEPIKGLSRFMEMLPAAQKDAALKEELLEALKESTDSGEFLLKAIGSAEGAPYTRELLAMCWEAGIDMTKHLAFFTELAVLSNDSFILLEVETVIQDMDLSNAILRKAALERLVASLSGKAEGLPKEITLDIIHFLESRD
jgi:hypothetical protein